MVDSDVPIPGIVDGLYINELEDGRRQHGMASSYLVLGESSCLFHFGTMSLVFLWIQCYNLHSGRK